jgi:hypothetical protein
MVMGVKLGLVRGLRGISLAGLLALPFATACGGDDEPCEDGGRQYGNGQAWTCADGCNGCTCQDGEITSTLVGCDSPPGPNAGKLSCHDKIWHQHGTTWSCADGCCTCDDGKTEAADPGSC